MTQRPEPLRVVVADDSPIVRSVVRHAFEDDGAIEVAAEAFDGVDALRQVEAARPDVLVLDLDMPRLSGLEVIARLMAERPLPILVLTAMPSLGRSELSLKAIEAGALDVMVKPSEWAPESGRALCSRVRLLARVGVLDHRPRAARAPEAPQIWRAPAPVRLLAVGASTGGPPLVARLLAALPRPMSAAVLVVQHIDDAFVGSFAGWLATESGREVRVAVAGERPEPGDVRVAPGGKDLSISPDGTLLLDPPEPGALHTPSIDVLFQSLARALRERAAAVLLSGLGSDGALGLKALKDAGGATLVLDPAQAVAPSMPIAAVRAGGAGSVLGPEPLFKAAASLVAADRRRGE